MDEPKKKRYFLKTEQFSGYYAGDTLEQCVEYIKIELENLEEIEDEGIELKIYIKFMTDKEIEELPEL